MATNIAVQQLGLGDFSLLTEVAANAGGNYFTNDGNTVFIVSNESADTPQEVTVAVNPDKYGRDKTLMLDVTNGRVGMIGPLDPAVFNDANGRVQITYEGVTNIKVFAVKLPKRPNA